MFSPRIIRRRFRRLRPFSAAWPTNARYLFLIVRSGSYTWSKLIDFQSDVFTANNTPAISETPTIFGGMANERAVSLFDRPQRILYLVQADRFPERCFHRE